MLYERWQSIARLHGNRVAVVDADNQREWTFSQLEEAAEKCAPVEAAILFPSGHNAHFIIQILNAWRHHRPALPLESGQEPPAIPPLPPNIAHLKTTSGSTGEPRLIGFTAEQLAADAGNIVSTMGLSPAIPNLGVISLAHSYGFSNLVTPLLLHGIPLILCPTPLPEKVKGMAASHTSVTVPAVPAMWRAWHDANSIPANIQLAISAGAPLPSELEQSVYERFHLKIHNFCGSSECGGIAYDRTDEPRTDPTLIGQPMDNVSLSINDEGRLVVESDAVGEGYLPDPSDQLGTRRFVTSDLAQLEHGELRITGRASDVINVAGRKLSPETVESVVRTQPGIRNCVVFGIPAQDETRFEEVVAAIELEPGADLAQAKQGVGRALAGWQIPRQWWIVERIETNARGKISRQQWRKHFLTQSSRTTVT